MGNGRKKLKGSKNFITGGGSTRPKNFQRMVFHGLFLPPVPIFAKKCLGGTNFRRLSGTEETEHRGGGKNSKNALILTFLFFFLVAGFPWQTDWMYNYVIQLFITGRYCLR